MPRLLRAWAVRLREGTHPEQHRHLSRASLRWVLSHRALGPGYLVRYARLLRLRLLHPDVVTHGMVFLGRGVRVETDPGYGRMHLGAFVHVGDRCVLRAHEGTLRVRDKVVMGSDVRVTCWLDVDLGEGTLLADWCYVADFDHVHDDVARPVKDQGIRKGAVRVGAGLVARPAQQRAARLGPGARHRGGRARRGQGPLRRRRRPRRGARRRAGRPRGPGRRGHGVAVPSAGPVRRPRRRPLRRRRPPGGR